MTRRTLAGNCEGSFALGRPRQLSVLTMQSAGSLSVRRPLNTGWRILPFDRYSMNFTVHTWKGAIQMAVSLPEGRLSLIHI